MKPSYDELLRGIIDFKPLKVASLFAGIGGIDLAFKEVGFKLSWANEIDKDACITMSSNFKHNIINSDIKTLDKVQKVDVVVGGFPCQSFSVAGYRKGLEDERGMIFFDMVRIINNIKPRAIMLENVKNLLTHNEGQSIQIIIKELEKVGYSVKFKVLNTCDYSCLPQNRERLYIVGFRDSKLLDDFKYPEPVNKRSSIRDFLDVNVSEAYYYDKTKIYADLKSKVISRDTFYQWRRKYVRENKNNLCPTLTANMGTGGHNVPLILDDNGIRKLTPRECFRLQGFPDDFVFPKGMARSKLYKQAGNSVSVPVVSKIASRMYNVLHGLDKEHN